MTWQTFGYDSDPRYRVVDIHYAYDCGSGIADQGGLSFTRDNVGNPTRWGDTHGIYTRAYGYDENNRLKSEYYPGLPQVDNAYDWVGNRNPSAATYNTADQLTAGYGQTCGYDAAGNLTHMGGSLRYTYTPANLLSTVAGGTSMTWDASGNRVSFTTSGQQTYLYLYDPTAGVPAVMEEVEPTIGSVYYIREPSGILIARSEGETTQYYHFDDLGSTLFLTGSDGTVTDKYTYDAWGNVTSHTGSVGQPYQYGGQIGYYTHYQQPDFDLLQLGVRFYNPEIGRLTQQDPIGDALNWYAYVGASPTGLVDPWGLYSVSEWWRDFKEGASIVYNLPSKAVGAMQGLLTRGKGAKDIANNVAALFEEQQASSGLTQEELSSLAELPDATRECGQKVNELNRKLVNDATWAVVCAGVNKWASWADNDIPIGRQLQGKGQLKDLRANPNLRKVNIEDLLAKSPSELEQMAKDGRISKKTLTQLKNAFQGRDLGSRKGG